jgi:uncharacterized RDD family membrane protein YckC
MSSGPEGTHLVRRSLAAILDYFLILGATSVFLNVQPWATPDATGNYGATGCALMLPFVVIWAFYFAGAEARFGRTLGKALFDMKVQRVDSGPPDFEQCIKRHLLDPIDLFLWGLPGLIAVKLSATHQRLGDMWGGTRVVLRRDGDPEGSNVPIA